MTRKDPPHGIRCPKCKGSKFRVAYTRHRPGKDVRVRECIKCSHRIRAVESIENSDVAKKKKPLKRK